MSSRPSKERCQRRSGTSQTFGTASPIALSAETGVGPDDVGKDSPLLSQSRLWAQIVNASATVWIVVFLGFLILLAIAAF
jgi:hypothetical protein